ncbi:MAG: hypothetical protein LBT96_03005 [Campylobacteraceae bacterium]|jgi:hypothetical protein|nr:hypothetical protein [Campylobacteraceae bacterium]
MQTKMQNFVKLIFLALVFGSLVGCGSSNDSETTVTEEVDTLPPSDNTLQKIRSYLSFDFDVFPDLRGHIFGDFWGSAIVETHTVKYSSLDNANAVEYGERVKASFPDILQILEYKSGVYHSLAWYGMSLVGDISVAITDDNGNYSVTQAIDIILPERAFEFEDIYSEIFTNGRLFPTLEGYPMTEIGIKIHYGYFGSPNFQAYKAELKEAGFKPKNGRADDNVWIVEGDRLIYTFEHDNPLLDATKIPILRDIPFLGSTLAGFTNHWITNWTNINKYASWKISAK